MSIRLFLTLWTITFIFSCQNQPQSTSISASNTPTDIMPQWVFQSKEDTLGNPQTQIFLKLKDSVSITSTTGSFRALEKQEFVEKHIPANTLSACWGFWAGLEQHFIVLDSSDCWVIKVKYVDEGNEKDENFETLKIIKK